MGAVLAAEFAARHPERVGRLTLISLPYFQSEGDVRNIAARLGLLARLTVGDHWGAKAACGLMCAFRPLLIFLAPILAPRLPSVVAQDALRHNFTSYSRSLQNVVVRHRLADTLSALAGRSVMLIHGETDRVVPIENVRPLAQRFLSFEIRVLPDTGHLLPIEQPVSLSRLLTR
jgi:pimeloyl-ACP methyl ester carboxylesterase